MVFAIVGGLQPFGANAPGVFCPVTAADGVTATRFEDLGSRIVGRGSIFLDDAFVPSDHRLGDEGGGFRQVMQGFDFSRALLGSSASARRRPLSTRRGGTSPSGGLSAIRCRRSRV